MRGFPEDFTEEDLRQAFSAHGTITSIKIAKHEDGSSKGFGRTAVCQEAWHVRSSTRLVAGFVCFSNNEGATQAQIEMHGTMLEGKPLHVSMHQSKEERQAELARTRQQQAMMQQQQQMGMQMGMQGMMVCELWGVVRRGGLTVFAP